MQVKMINKIYDDLQSAVVKIPNGVITPYIKLNNLYYEHSSKKAEWTGFEAPRRTPYVAYELNRLDQHFKKNTAELDVWFEYGEQSDMINDIIGHQQRAVIAINFIVYFLHKLRCKTYTAEKAIEFDFYDLETEKLYSITEARFKTIILTDLLYNDICCIYDNILNG